VTSLVVELRRATADVHDALDRSVAGRVADLDRYAAFVGRLAAGHRAAEHRLADHPLVTASGHLPKAFLAEADLAELGATSGTTVDADVADWMLAPVDDHDAAGILYVMEGATLGGRHLAGVVRRRFPEAAGSTRLLDAYGDETAIRWQRTRRVIDAADADTDRAAAAAVDAFAMFRRLIDGVPT
jgi:heme oxygenase